MQDEIVDTGLEDAVSFITFQQEHNSKCRAPFLAQMELQSRLIARRDPKADGHDMVALMIGYFKKFGSKQCAAMDLKLYLPSLEESDVTKFFQEIYEEIEFNEEKFPKDIDNMQRDVNWHQLHRFSGSYQGFPWPKLRIILPNIVQLPIFSICVIYTFSIVGKHHAPLADTAQRYQIAKNLFQVISK